MTRRIGVVGGGTMGVGIAYVFAAAGWDTIVVEPDDGRADAAHRALVAAAASGVQRGRLDAHLGAALPDAVRRVRAVADLDEGLDLVVESVPERMDLKREVLAGAEARRPSVLATNTSALSIDELAAGLARPGQFLGLHFFNPVWSLALVEVVRGAATDDETLTRACEWVEAIGKQPAVVRDSPGFATSRLDLVAAIEAMRMVDEGVGTPEAIDRAVCLAYRHPVGPLRLSDIVGLDVRLDIARRLEVSLGPRFAPPRILEELVAAGHLGVKTGQGFYPWPTDAGPEPREDRR